MRSPRPGEARACCLGACGAAVLKHRRRMSKVPNHGENRFNDNLHRIRPGQGALPTARLSGEIAAHDAVALQLVVESFARDAQRLDGSPDVAVMMVERLADDGGLVTLHALGQRRVR